MGDYLLRAIAREAGVRGLACITTDLANEGARRHETTPTATAVLGHGLTAAALFGALLKVQQRVAIKYEGSGPIQKMVVESDSYGKIRGYVANPAADVPRTDDGENVKAALGNLGVLTVVKDLRLKELTESVVPTAGGALDEELTFYLNQSEQIPSVVEMGVYLDENGAVKVAGGLLLQALPSHEDDTIIEQMRNRLQEMPPMSAMLHSGMTPETVLADLFGEIEYEVLEERPLAFKCTCSRERSEKALIMLGRDEVGQLLDTEGEAVIDCHFCHERYIFNRADLEGLLVEMS